MANIIFMDNTTLKIFDSNENASSKKLSLKFPTEFYTVDEIKGKFDSKKKDNYSTILKTTEDGIYITEFNDYTKRISIGTEIIDISKTTTKEVVIQDEEGNPISTTVPETIVEEVEVITVVLAYEDPTAKLVDKLNQKINPTIDIETCTLEELQKYRQEKNKEAMNDFFRTHPLLHTDGLYYGIEDEDRREMSEEFLGYMLEVEANPDAALEWHSKGTACTPRTKEEFASIAIAIRNYTKPYFREMQEAKEAIFAATTKEEVLAVKIFSGN